MKTGNPNGCRATNRRTTPTQAAPRRQQGVVLLVALIILVAMTLAGIGMMRSVDTGSVIAGNMAFRQATMNASDAGTSAGFNALMSVANSSNSADKTILNFNNGQPCPGGTTAAGCPGSVNINLPGYSSTPIFPCEVTRTCATASNYTWWTVDANWNGAPTVAVPDPGTTVQYLIHRMCQVPNEPQAYTPTPMPGGTQLCQNAVSNCGAPPCSRSFFYRITARSVGVKNTVTYTQAMVNIN